MKKLRLYSSCLVFLFLSLSVFGRVMANSIVINDGWEYLENNTSSLERASTANEWQTISLPHTWNATDTVDSQPGYRRNASWYRRSITKSIAAEKRYFLRFEGANMETRVFVNSELVGEHVGGYLGFEFDITEALASEGNNTLMVRVSNQLNRDLIPSQKADFFIHGGITRDVWLDERPTAYISEALISTPSVSESSAETKVKVRVVNHRKQQNYTIQASVIDPDGAVVLDGSQVTEALSSSGQQYDLTVLLPSLNEPKLWSPDAPTLYSMQIDLRDSSGAVVHRQVEKFGYRWFEMKPQQGFFVNGKQTLIRGTHRHEEHAGLGAALSNEQHYRDMEMIKDMGANFVRLGHYPQDPEVYKAADELGLIIWDELPWCRGGKGGQEWEKNTERLLEQQIRQNYNHASIAFWSLGNEIYWESDFEGGGDPEKLNPYLQKLNNIVKDLDTSRLTTIRKYYDGATIPDSFSPSIWAGWYGGAYNQYEEALANAHKLYPNFLHMEYGGSSHVGRHTETPIGPNGMQNIQVSVEEAVNQTSVRSVAKDSDWNENYMVDLFDWHLNVSETFRNFAGNAQWAFKDFGTPLRPENPLPYVNQKGLVDRDGKPKDAYYVFASYWSKTPICYIESESWTHRYGPKEGRDVSVYCSTESAELYLNGKSLGRKTKQMGNFPASGLAWTVPFEQGKNTLKVIGYKGKDKVAEDDQVVTYYIGEPDKVDRISLSIAGKTPAGNLLIEALALDKQGRRVTNFEERAYFFNIGEQGSLLQDYGTPTRSAVIEMANGRAAIEFKPGGEASVIEFRSQNNKGVYLEVPSQ